MRIDKKTVKTVVALATAATVGHITQAIFDHDAVDEEDLNLLGRASKKISDFWSMSTEAYKEKIGR